MKKIVRVAMAIVVIAANLGAAIYAAVLVANFMVDYLNLTGFWVFPDAIVTVCVGVVVFLALKHVAHACNITLD